MLFEHHWASIGILKYIGQVSRPLVKFQAKVQHQSPILKSQKSVHQFYQVTHGYNKDSSSSMINDEF